MNRLFLAVGCTVLSGCQCGVPFDAEGRRCDTGGFCPEGFVCREDVCQSAPTALVCPAVACNSPPPNVCIGKVRRAFQTGICSSGTCFYAPTDFTCPGECADAKCVGVDACLGIECTVMPTPICIGNTLRRFGDGFCAAGTCQFPPSDAMCPNECRNGACVGPMTSLTFSQIGPQVKFAVSALDGTPADFGAEVLAVGKLGQVAHWNGTLWRTLTAPTAEALNGISFVSPTVALAAGDNKTLLSIQATSGNVTALSLPGGATTTDLIGVSGRAENNYLVADATGGVWRANSAAPTYVPMPSADGPFDMKGLYLDETGRERIVGKCKAKSCVAYRNPAPGTTPNVLFFTENDNLGYSAVGGNFDVPATNNFQALLGQSDNSLTTVSNEGTFSKLNLRNQVDGAGFSHLTVENTASSIRAVYALTSTGAQTEGQVYRLTRRATNSNATNIALLPVLRASVMSPHDSNGVMVAEISAAGNASTIFRVSDTASEALDVGADLIAAANDATGSLTLASNTGDIFAKGSSTYKFRRPAQALGVRDAEAGNGTGVLMVGKTGATGFISRAAAPSASGPGYVAIASRNNASFNSVCRVSDTEGWAVGTNGLLAKLSGTNATFAPGLGPSDFLDVDCAKSRAVTCGTDGTVWLYDGVSWTQLPAVPGKPTISLCKLLSPTGVLAGGDGVFFKYEASWLSLPSKPKLRALVVKSETEVYGAVDAAGGTSEIVRFDGAQWTTSFTAKSAVSSGAKVGNKVLFTGASGLLIEGR
jgi:hypothetical protein